jgi:3-dehydroquinate dehydratase
MKSSHLRHANDLRCILIQIPQTWMNFEIELMNLIHESQSKNEPLVILNNSNLREIT